MRPVAVPNLTATLEEPIPGNAALRLGLDVRPEGITFLAQVRLYARREADALPHALPYSGPEAPDAAADEQLTGFRGWAQDFLERVRDQVQPALQAEACRVIGDLADENDRLRSALGACVSACAPLLARAEQAGLLEGCEGDQARAWLALESAREALAGQAALPPPGLR